MSDAGALKRIEQEQEALLHATGDLAATYVVVFVFTSIDVVSSVDACVWRCSEESAQGNPLFLRLLELKAKYSAISHDTAPTPPSDAMDVDGLAAAVVSSSGSGSAAPTHSQHPLAAAGPRATKRRKIGVDADSLHRSVTRILQLHRGAAHVDVLAAALMPHWSQFTADDAAHVTLTDVRAALRQHLQTYRLNEAQPVYTAVRGDAHVWTLNPASLEGTLEDKDGILLLPGASKPAPHAAPSTPLHATESLGHAILTLLQSYATASTASNQSASEVEAALVTQLSTDTTWLSLRATDPGAFDSQVRFIVRHHPAAIKLVAALCSHGSGDELATDDVDAMDEDTDTQSPTGHTNGAGPRRPRPPRRAVTHTPPNSRQPSHAQPAPHGSNMPGSAVQAAKQRRMHQMHHGGQYRSPPVGRARPRQPKARAPSAASRSSSHNHTYVTLSAGVLGLQLSAAANAARSATQLPAENSSCTQCSAPVDKLGWFRGPTTTDWLCESCGEIWSREHSCPVCGLVYDEEDDGDDLFISAELYRTLQLPSHPESTGTDAVSNGTVTPAPSPAAEQSSWIACDDCGRWVMTKCDGIVDLSLYDDENPNHLPYKCPLCRGAKESIPRIFFTRHSAPTFAKLYLSSSNADSKTKPQTDPSSTTPGKQATEVPSPSVPKKKATPKMSTEKDISTDSRVLEEEPRLQGTLDSVDSIIGASDNHDVFSRIYETERCLMDQWMRQRETVRFEDPARVDQLKSIERKLLEKIRLFRDSMNHALSAMLERNRQDYESQAARLRKEHAILDQLAEDEVIKQFEMHFKTETEKFSQFENTLKTTL